MVGHRIEMGEVNPTWAGQWVDIKNWMSWSASKRIEQASYAITLTRGSDKGQIATDPIEEGIVLIESQVLQWALTDHHDAAIPPTRAGITGDAVPSDLLDAVVEAIKGYYDVADPVTFSGS